MIRLIIVDDHQIFVDGVKSLITEMEGVIVVAEANNGVDLMDCLSKKEADIVLMDLSMPLMDGIAATKMALKDYPDLKVLMLTMQDSKTYIETVLKAGAHGYVLKNTGVDELELAIKTIMKGEHFYSSTVTQRIMDNVRSKKETQKRLGYVELTEREKEVLILIAQEFQTAEIAEQLFISYHTVESHRKNLINKLQVRGSNGLVRYAVESGLLD